MQLDVWRRSSYISNLSRGDWPKRANELGVQVADGKKETGFEPELEVAMGRPDISSLQSFTVNTVGTSGGEAQTGSINGVNGTYGGR